MGTGTKVPFPHSAPWPETRVPIDTTGNRAYLPRSHMSGDFLHADSSRRERSDRVRRLAAELRVKAFRAGKCGYRVDRPACKRTRPMLATGTRRLDGTGFHISVYVSENGPQRRNPGSATRIGRPDAGDLASESMGRSASGVKKPEDRNVRGVDRYGDLQPVALGSWFFCAGDGRAAGGRRRGGRGMAGR